MVHAVASKLARGRVGVGGSRAFVAASWPFSHATREPGAV